MKEKQEFFYKLATERMKDEKNHFDKGINISDIVYDLLEELGFDRTSNGTKYLEDVITTLYHERKMFDQEKEYFDFNDLRNNHYIYTREFYECRLVEVTNNINDAINKSYLDDKTPNDVIYDVVNDVISQCARDTKRLEYKKD